MEKIVWSGNGDKLLLETTNNGKVRRFLDNVPHLLSRIKSIHTASINNDLDGMKVGTKTLYFTRLVGSYSEKWEW